MQATKQLSWRSRLVNLVAVVGAVAACSTERNRQVCCTTVEDCAALGVDGPEGWECGSGQVCIRNACVATECQAASDCPATAPICSPDQRCVGCVDPSDCGGRTCDAETHTCSGCLSNSECASGVCSEETGVCASASSIVYAAPGAPAASDCLQGAPCSIKTALTVASTHPDRSIVLMAPGNYPTDLEIVGGNPITIIGEAATVTSTGNAGLGVSGGADVTVNGLTIATLVVNPDFSSSPIVCTGASGARTKLRLRGVFATGMPIHGFYVSSTLHACDVIMDRVTLRQSAVYVESGMLIIDRSSLVNVGALVGTALVVSGDVQHPAELTMTNSVVTGGVLFNDQINHTINISFSTIYGCEGPALSPLGCNRGIEWAGASGTAVSLRNNVIVGQMVADSLVCSNCGSLLGRVVNNLIYPQNTIIPGNFVAPPQLVNPANNDFRLRPGSPAIDAADAVTTDHDYTGAARPVGPRADLGALEYSP